MLGKLGGMEVGGVSRVPILAMHFLKAAEGGHWEMNRLSSWERTGSSKSEVTSTHFQIRKLTEAWMPWTVRSYLAMSL